MSAAREVVVLGSTGSIGTQALDVVDRNPDRFRVVGLAGGGTPTSVPLLARQAVDHAVEVVAVAEAGSVPALRDALAAEASARRGASGGPVPLPHVIAGDQGVEELARRPCDVVLNALPGAAGLRPTLAALKARHTLALANKESLIIGGALVRALAAPDQLVPVDSEHSALAQCLRGGRADEVHRLVLTASGGPFRGRARAELSDVTPAQALAHPTWSMGPLVTVNSATLVNKGLEVVEAHLLFGLPYERIEVVVHPQSVVHSMVEFADGSTLAQASPPDMRMPIALALGWPDRVPGAARPCDWSAATRWEFEPLDQGAFPAVALAREAGVRGGTAPAVYNAANEICVAAFLAGSLPFLSIVDTVADVLGEHGGSGGGTATVGRASEGRPAAGLTLDDVLAADAWARTRARERVAAQRGRARG